MLIFGFIFLIPTTTLASSYDNYGSLQHFIDYNGDPHSRYLEVKPGSNIIFNFEQLRRDQPPQREMRDESLGLYMHARSQTTTTMAPIVVTKFKAVSENKVIEDNDPFSRFSYLSAPVQDPQTTPIYNHYHPNPSTPMPPPPIAPKWSDFPETFNKQAFPHYESRKSFVQNHAVSEFNYSQRPQHYSSGTEEKLFKQRMASAPDFNHFQQPQHQLSAYLESGNIINNASTRLSSPTTKDKTHDNIFTKKKEENSRQNLSIANRGSHKFNWNDLVTEPSWIHEPQQMSSTLAPVTHQGQNPPPLPTLSAWIDGFGK